MTRFRQPHLDEEVGRLVTHAWFETRFPAHGRGPVPGNVPARLHDPVGVREIRQLSRRAFRITHEVELVAGEGVSVAPASLGNGRPGYSSPNTMS